VPQSWQYSSKQWQNKSKCRQSNGTAGGSGHGSTNSTSSSSSGSGKCG